MNTNAREWNFRKLVGIIRQVHEELTAQAGRAVNLNLTMRNWLIGGYIAEYELSGATGLPTEITCSVNFPGNCAGTKSVTPAAGSYTTIWPFIAPILRLCGQCPHKPVTCFHKPLSAKKCGQCPHNWGLRLKNSSAAFPIAISSS